MKEKENVQKNDNKNNKVISKIIIAAIAVTLVVCTCIFIFKLFNKDVLKFNISFETNGGSLIEDIIVNENNKITEPEEPIKENHEFIGWYYNDELYDFNKPVTSDIKLEARWEKIENVSGIKLDHKQVKLKLGDKYKLIATVLPENANNKNVIWESSSPNIVSVDSEGNIKALREGNVTITVTTEDGEYKAQVKIFVEKIIDNYTVTFTDEDGTILSDTQTLKIGSKATMPAEPTKEGHIFQGWYNGETKYTFTEQVKENVVLTAKWTKQQYTIVFLNDDGSILEIKKVDHGTKPTYKIPTSTQLSDEQYSYVFAGWTPNVTEAKEYATYTAVYEKTTNKYEVIFKDEDGSLLSETQTIEYGSKVTEPVQPTKEGYTFQGWYNGQTKYDFTEKVKGKVTLTAKWETNKYTITFVDYDGTILEIQTVEYGTVPTYTGTTPEKVADNTYTYTFNGWDKELVKVTGDATYTAAFTEKYIDYTIKFVNEDGTLLSEKTYHFGETVEQPVNPEKTADEQYTYTFAGWTPNVTPVEKDETYTATYTSTINEYEVTFKEDDGTVLSETQSIEYGKNATEPVQPSKDGYTFKGWYNGEEKYTFTETIKGNVNLTAKWEINNYTITFANYDGTILETQTVEYGRIPTYTGTTPVKVSDNTYTYTFNGWDKELVKVTSDVTYTATFTENYIEYVIKFVDEDGTVLSEKTYHFGENVEQPVNPSKPADEQYTYTFAGWTPSVTLVEKDEIYTATYTSTINKYEVKFVNYDGTILETQTVEYGTIPTYTLETPVKVSNNTYTYIFKGWDKDLVKVTGDAIYIAVFTEKYIDYTIKFVDEDGTVLSEKTYHYGETVEQPANPQKTGNEQYTYTFAGWTPSVTVVEKDETYTATYTATINEYEIKFVNCDGTILETQTIQYGIVPIYTGVLPEKVADNTYTYTFKGWDKELVKATSDATYTAVFTEKYVDYIIKFVNEDGTVLSEKIYHYGETVEQPANPQKTGNEQYTYTFAGWTPNVTSVDKNQTYTAKYTSTVNKYEVKFVNYDGTILETQTVEYGTMPTYTLETPVKSANNIYTYIFNGWDKELVKVTMDTTYTAVFTEKYVDYTIKFVNEDGTLLSEKTYHYGETVEQPANPEKTANEQYTYTFAGWTPSVTAVEKDEIYTATYTSTINKYEVTFKDEDGTVLSQTQIVEYGEKATEPVEPSKDGYTFKGWYNGENKYSFANAVKGNINLTAKWEIHKYTITFVNYDGTVLETQTVDYGTVPTYTSATPVKDSTNIYKYIFNGWDKELIEVTSDTTYTATYTETYIDYTIKFVNEDGTVLSEKTYHYGETVQQPTNPSKPADEQYTYTFAGWTPNVTSVEKDQTYMATYTSTINKYEVTFKDEDGTTLSATQIIEYGNTAAEPVQPTKEGHVFQGWYNGQTKYDFAEKVKGNITLTAKWAKNQYTITFVNYDGTVLETQTVGYGEMPTYKAETPVKPADSQHEYIFVGWTPSITVAKKDVTYKAVFKYLVDVDGDINTALLGISGTASNYFKVTKEQNKINVKFVTPDDLINMFYDIVKVFDAISCNENYQAFELYYKHAGHSKGQTIDLTKYDLKDTRPSSWFGSGANDRVGDWLGYLASGTASTTAAFNAHSNDLIGKSVEVTIKLKDGYVLENGSDLIVYNLTFSK